MCEAYERPVLKGYDRVNGICYLYQVRCKQWSCPDCARANKVAWQAKIGYGYDWYVQNNITDWMFVTLTSHPKLTTSEQCLYVWKRAWPKLSARMRRAFPGIKYVLLPEYHKDGRVHWHSIMSHGITKRWLKDNSAACGLGHIADSDSVNDSWKAIYYVSKYIGKSLGVFEWPSGLRRIRTSQKWPKQPPSEWDGKIDVQWKYLSTYPSDGLDYLASGIEEKEDIKVKILRG